MFKYVAPTALGGDFSSRYLQTHKFNALHTLPSVRIQRSGDEISNRAPKEGKGSVKFAGAVRRLVRQGLRSEGGCHVPIRCRESAIGRLMSVRRR
jgi:hypothetical protein